MKLVIFDVDNTLTNTGRTDQDCFLQAVNYVFNIKDIDTDWSHYKNVTAISILDQILRAKSGKVPRKREISDMRDAFLSNLKERSKKRPGEFSEVPGASNMMTELLRKSEFASAIATGSFADGAAFKLEFAKIPYKKYCIASGAECFTREELIDIAVTKAKSVYGVSNFESVISVGDGIWDLKTASNIGMPFVGVGNKQVLEQNGVKYWVNDYRDLPGFFSMLAGAV